VKIEEENQTLASITFQNYFRMYEKLAGMTGTAATEAQEFADIYKLDVLTIPTHKPMSASTTATRSSRPKGRIRGDNRGNQRAVREGPARAGRHHFH